VEMHATASTIPTQHKIKFYATTWCGDCRRAKRWLDEHHIPYDYINIEEDEAAAAYVIEVNHGLRSVPTIVFPDGSILVEPSNRQLAEKLSSQGVVGERQGASNI
jgi:mycoredoxin